MEHGLVVLIPVDEINILNPRARNPVIAEGIRQNILEVGLKRPVTVTPRKNMKKGKKYNLVCGQGGLEAYMAAGEKEVPAIVRDVSAEDALLMSLVENIARRKSNGLELLQSIKYLKGLGYEDADIAAKTSLSKDYIKDILLLLAQGEEYLVNAVEKGRVPLSQAIRIATEKDIDVQLALAEAYESGALPGGKLVTVQRVIARRKHYGKGLAVPKRKKTKISSAELMADYEKSVKEKKVLVSQSNYIKRILAYTAAALKQLLDDRHFTNQLKAVHLDDIPLHITEIIDRRTRGKYNQTKLPQHIDRYPFG